MDVVLDVKRGDGSSVSTSIWTQHGQMTTRKLFQSFIFCDGLVRRQQIPLLLNSLVIHGNWSKVTGYKLQFEGKKSQGSLDIIMDKSILFKDETLNKLKLLNYKLPPC